MNQQAYLRGGERASEYDTTYKNRLNERAWSTNRTYWLTGLKVISQAPFKSMLSPLERASSIFIIIYMFKI
jgi:hypothetical protein